MPVEPMRSTCYTPEYYDELKTGATRSAEIVVPILLRLLSVRSVVDVGCGQGAWLAAFRKSGVEDVLGIDGDYVDRGALAIPEHCFRAVDLSSPFAVERTFDLAVSLEVAEHLPAESAAGFIESLTRLAPAVLFSAAIPFQGGTQHINEQWQHKWAELFKERGYAPVDAIRRQIWQSAAVEWWYAQNTILYVHTDLLRSNPSVKTESDGSNAEQLSLVHPRQYIHMHNEYLHLQSLYKDALRREEYLKAHPASGVKQASRILWDCVRNSVRAHVRSAGRGRRSPESAEE